MNKYIKKALKYVYKIVIVASLVSVNVTCLGRYLNITVRQSRQSGVARATCPD